jgi:monofunctional biosynthetic peptidoglycan transglycosylase
LNNHKKPSRFWSFFFWTVIGTLFFLVLYTVYSLFGGPDVCELAKRNPKSTEFMERKKDKWEDDGKRHKIDQRWVPLSAISRHLKNAVVVTEDPNFYSHKGINFYAIKLALEEDIRQRRIAYGASTITQQLMKNLYLSPWQNPLRKWREAILALRVERCVKKSRILEIYLNVIEWGDSIYGIEAASRRYFGKSAASLDITESALLTAMIPNPIRYNPYKRNPQLIKNKNLTLRLMLRAGKISRADYYAALNDRINLR